MKKIDELKCGGKVKKKVSKHAEGGKVDNKDALSAIPDAVATALAEMLEEKKNNLVSDIDPRENPAAVMQKANNLSTGSALLKGAGKGASIGTMIAPGIGTAIGAGIGALTSGIGRLVGAKDRREDLRDATESWSNNFSSKTAGALRTHGYKKGGEIEGPGTGKSDSIKMKADDGSFIVPAENAEYAKELGQTFLGWDQEEKSDKGKGKVDIKVSDGEIMFTPQESAILRYHGIDLDKLAPKAKKSNEMKKFVTGGETKEDPEEDYRIRQGNPLITDINQISTGLPIQTEAKSEQKKDDSFSDWKYDPQSKLVMSKAGSVAYDKKGNEYKVNPDTNQFEETGTKSPYGSSIYGEYGENESVLDLMPELLGAIQAAGGATGLIAAGRSPDMRVSETLKQLSSETRRLAEFGYEPAVINSLNQQIDKTRSDMSRLVNEGNSASGLERMSQLNNILSTTIDKKAGLAFADAAEKSRKYADVLRVDAMKAGQEFDINRMKVEDWYKNQEVFAELAMAGISNIVGARQLKAEQDVIKKVGSTTPTWNKK